jgi:hypothetical protein
MSIVLWDIERFQPIQHFHRPGLSVIDMDICGLMPVYIASDGAFRFATAAIDAGKDELRNAPVSVHGLFYYF